MVTLGPCIGCRLARALVTFEGEPLCVSCFEGGAQEALAEPDVDDGAIAFVAMACARLIAEAPELVITIGTPGVRDDVWPRVIAACMFHGLHVELDAVEGICEVCDLSAILAWAARLCANAEADVQVMS